MRKWREMWIGISIFLNLTVANAAEQMGQSIPTDNVPLDSCETRLNSNGYGFQAEARPDLYGARTGPAVMSKRGDLYEVVTQAARTGIYNFTKDKFTAFEDGSYADVADLFESRSGRMYFAYITQKDVKVFDARTGNSLLALPLAEIQHVGDVVAQLSSETSLYRPILFETTAGVQVAIVPRSEDLYLDEAFSVPLATINLRTGEKNVVHSHSGSIRYERMQDGHVYGFGWEREMGGPANTLLVFDLNMQKTLLREKFEHQQEPPIISGPLNLFFRSPRQPELAMHLQSPTGKVLVFDRESRKFQPLPGLSRAKTVSIQFYNDDADKPWFAAIEGSEGSGLNSEFFRLVIQPMADIHGAAVVDLDLEHPLNDISAVETIERPEGRLFLAWERTVFEGKVRYSRVHVYDLKRRQLVTIGIPSEWPGAIRKKAFWDPVRHTLVAFFLRDDGSTPEFATLYNPNRVVPVETPPPTQPSMD